jgi:hypothetical protein
VGQAGSGAPVPRVEALAGQAGNEPLRLHGANPRAPIEAARPRGTRNQAVCSRRPTDGAKAAPMGNVQRVKDEIEINEAVDS